MKYSYVIIVMIYLFSLILSSCKDNISEPPKNNETKVDSLGKNSFRYITFSSATDGVIVGDSGTIIRTIDGGSNWKLMKSSENYHLNAVCSPSSQIYYTVGSNGAILFSSDAGQNWEQHHMISQYPPWFQGVSFSNDSVGISTFENKIIRTKDRGLSWDTVYLGQEGSTNYDIKFINPDTAFAIAGGYIARSTDQGLTWIKYNSNAYSLLAISFSTKTSGVAVGCYGRIIKTNDCGMTWQIIQSGTNNDLSGISFANSFVGYAVGQFGTILKTTNSGESWDTLSSPTSNYLEYVYMVSSNLGYAVGVNGCIVKITNNGCVLVH